MTRRKKNTENRAKRDEKRSKGELLCRCLFEEETSMQPAA